MPRTSWILIIALMSWSGSFWALEANDTMAAWKNASADQERKLASDILKRTAPLSVIKCLDAAADVFRHADSPIAEVVEACDANGSEPV